MPDKRVLLRVEAVRRLMRKGAMANLRRIIDKTHPADLAAVFQQLNDIEQGKFIQLLAQCEVAGDVLNELSPQVASSILQTLKDADLAAMLSSMESDDAADLLSLLPEGRRSVILAAVSPEDSRDIGRLLAYPEDSAGGIMNPSFFAVRETATARDAIQELQKAEDAETVFYVYVVDEEDKLVGVISLRQIIVSPPSATLRQIMNPNVLRVDVYTDQEQVARLVDRYDFLAIPVVDENQRLVGLITVDDVIDVLREEATEDVFKMAGTSQEELVYGNRVLPIARIRVPWLLVNLFGGLLTGAVLWLFRGTIEEIVALLAFVPVITAMGGNVGTQSSSILVRAFATGRVDFDNLYDHLWKELKVGLVLGILCGLVVGISALIWHNNIYLGIVVAASMVAAMTVASAMGTLAPAFFRRVGIDPAVASGPFVTTSNDVVGILIYLGTATALLRFLPHTQ